MTRIDSLSRVFVFLFIGVFLFTFMSGSPYAENDLIKPILNSIEQLISQALYGIFFVVLAWLAIGLIAGRNQPITSPIFMLIIAMIIGFIH